MRREGLDNTMGDFCKFMYRQICATNDNAFIDEMTPLVEDIYIRMKRYSLTKAGKLFGAEEENFVKQYLATIRKEKWSIHKVLTKWQWEKEQQAEWEARL